MTPEPFQKPPRTAGLGAVRASLDAYPRFPYPWEGLEASIAERDAGALSLVGYGSLMNLESAARTLTVSRIEELEPIRVFGVQRVFDYRMPRSIDARYGKPADERMRAALNVYPVPDRDAWINAVRISVDVSEIGDLRQREVAYRLEPALCLPWKDDGGTPSISYVLSCQGDSWKGETYTDPGLLPHEAYLELCMAGARAFSQSVLDAFLETTVLADRRTTLADYIARSAK